MELLIIFLIIMIIAGGLKAGTIKQPDTIKVNSEITKKVISEYDSIVKKYAIKNNFEYDTDIILAMICLESNGIINNVRLEIGYFNKYILTDDRLKSKLERLGIYQNNFGSYGLMQVLPSTAIGFNNFKSYTDFFNVDKNIDTGIKYLIDRINYSKKHNSSDHLIYGIMYYNTGSVINMQYYKVVKSYYDDIKRIKNND